ncbi:MAG: rhomboid family intramembrane serine protease [Pseudomonadota bacterium]
MAAMTDYQRREPVFNVPAVVIVVLLMLLAFHAMRELAGPFWDHKLMTYLALYPYRLGPDGSDEPGGGLVGVTSLATHALLHGNWLHLLLNSAWLLAFGSLIARRTSAAGFLGLFIACAVAGGLAYVAINGYAKIYVIGASGAVSGLMGAAFRIIFVLPHGGLAVLQHHPQVVPRMPLGMALSHRQTVLASAFWIVANLLFGLASSSIAGGGGIAWEAHLGGFIAGFLLFGAFDRGRAMNDTNHV